MMLPDEDMVLFLFFLTDSERGLLSYRGDVDILEVRRTS